MKYTKFKKMYFLNTENHNFFITVVDVYRVVETLARDCKLLSNKVMF